MTVLPVSVVILTRNSGATVRECLESVSGSGPYEIIVVDGGSTDGTLDIVRQYTDRVYFDEGKGLCHARQLGAEMAGADYIAYVDSDIVLLPDTLATMLAELKEKGYGSITARQVMTGGGGYLKWAHRRYKNVISPERPGEIRVVPMRSTIIPRELIIKYGFDLSMPDADGSSIGFRLSKGGYRHGMSSAQAQHYRPAGGKSRSTYWEGVAAAEFMLRNAGSPGMAARYTLGTLGNPVYCMLRSVAKGELRLIPYFLYIFLMVAAGFTGKLFTTLVCRMRRVER